MNITSLTIRSTLVLLSALVSAAVELTPLNRVDLSTVQKRVAELQPRPEEKRFDEIGWAKDIRDAERLAKESGRPIFLFTHDGRINLGRC